MDLKSEVGSRISFLLEEKGIQQKDFADRIGITNIHLSKVIHGENGVTLQRLEEICISLNISLAEFFSTFTSEALPAPLAANSLLLKCAGLTSDDIHILEVIADHLQKRKKKQAEDSLYFSPIAGAAAAGLPLNDAADPDAAVSVPRKYLDTDRYRIFTARGDSMEPKIPNGSCVVAQLGDPPQNGEIAVIRISSLADDEYTIKRFYVHGDQAELKSINAKYSPMIYPLSEIQSAARVVHYLPSASL